MRVLVVDAGIMQAIGRRRGERQRRCNSMSENGERAVVVEPIMPAMILDDDACYRALTAHDARFDGRFFVGVRSTGVYCRPVCTVRAPRRENCRFYPSAAAAEAAGFRPCLRCRPELAPGFSAVDAPARIAQAAIGLIEDGFLEDRGIEDLAGRIGVSSRHLRRIFEAHLGVTPVEYAQTQRLLLAKRLLSDTTLPVTDVAFASGFASVRRLNALFRARYRMSPSRLRDGRAGTLPAALAFALAFRPPYAWDALRDYLGARAIRGVERCDGRGFRRSLAIGHRGQVHAGWIEASIATRRPVLSLRVSPSLARVLPQVLGRVRHAFDLGADPDAVARTLGPLAEGEPGLRVPGAFDGFELAVRAVVGQQVSVASATTLLGRVAARHGAPIDDAPEGIDRVFPAASAIAALAPAELAALGITLARARTIVALAREIENGLDLSPSAPPHPTIERLAALPGIGPWTVQYVALRALGLPDAFPHTDLGVMRALGETSPARVLERAEAWRPWRGYAAFHLWRRPSRSAP
jgi:AraC family transcriptional regulator of adaptative response / DNA-3-methyladenine glycosylase II